MPVGILVVPANTVDNARICPVLVANQDHLGASVSQAPQRLLHALDQLRLAGLAAHGAPTAFHLIAAGSGRADYHEVGSLPPYDSPQGIRPPFVTYGFESDLRDNAALADESGQAPSLAFGQANQGGTPLQRVGVAEKHNLLGGPLLAIDADLAR